MIIRCNIEASCFNVLNSIFCDLENKSTFVENNIHFIIYWYTLLLHQKHVWNIRHVLIVCLGNTVKSIRKHGELKTWIETLESNIPTLYIHIFYDVYKNINFLKTFLCVCICSRWNTEQFTNYYFGLFVLNIKINKILKLQVYWNSSLL